MSDRGRVHGRNLGIRHRAVEQALGHGHHVALVGVEQTLGAGEAGELGREATVLGLHGLVGRMQVGAQGIQGGQRGVEGLMAARPIRCRRRSTIVSSSSSLLGAMP